VLAIVWNPNGFPVINVLSKGIKFNTSQPFTDVLIPLAEWCKTQISRTDRKLIVHADDARLHLAKMSLDFLERNEMTKVPQSLYSPRLAPFDFYLFGRAKRLLAGHGFLGRGAILDAVHGILRGIEKVTLDRTFLVWIERLDRCTTIKKDYVE
jgi:hypothetical protein